MAKTKGMWFYQDWIEIFSELSATDFKKLFFAMTKYFFEGEEPPEFKGKAKIVASFIFPQLKRSRQGAENGAKGGNPNLINGLNPPLNQELNQSGEIVEPKVEPSERKRKEAKEKELTETNTNTVVVSAGAGAHTHDEQQQQPNDYIFVGTHKNIRVRKSWLEAFKAKYTYAGTAIDHLSEYKKRKGITAFVTDEQYLEEWAETDRERFEHLREQNDKWSSFDIDDFWQTALKRSYGK